MLIVYRTLDVRERRPVMMAGVLLVILGEWLIRKGFKVRGVREHQVK
jgi:hypothetical protein